MRAAPASAGPVGQHGFRGNKAALPAKTCAVCGRPMVWRRAWARTWDEVKYCSERCRRARPPAAAVPERR